MVIKNRGDLSIMNYSQSEGSSNLGFSIDNSLDYYRHQNIPGGDLRVSIVAHCDMNCLYCHNEGQESSVAKFMSLDTLRSVVTTGIKFGVSKVRLTGGEPLLHPDVVEMVKMLKKDLSIRSVGINTNATKLSPVMVKELVDSKLDVLVVGLDHFDSAVSKNSPVGEPSKEIMCRIVEAKRSGLSVQVASVYDESNLDDILHLAKWCRDNSILFKVLEFSDNCVAKRVSVEFVDMINLLRTSFELRMGKTVALNELFGLHGDGNRILFFHSHCKIRECHECSQMHMRVTADGNAKPCLLRTDTEYSLIGSDPGDSIRRAIHNLGNGPGNKPL